MHGFIIACGFFLRDRYALVDKDSCTVPVKYVKVFYLNTEDHVAPPVLINRRSQYLRPSVVVS